MTRERIQLSDQERHDIRWSQRKLGYVVVVDWHRGPRGARFRPLRSGATTSFDRAADWAATEPGRYRQNAAAVTIYEVDAMGRVTEEMGA
jgi:hypothetical protein